MPVLIHQQKQAVLACDSRRSKCIVLLPCLSVGFGSINCNQVPLWWKQDMLSKPSLVLLTTHGASGNIPIFLAQLSVGLTSCACLYLVLPLSFPILHSLQASCTGSTTGKTQMLLSWTPDLFVNYKNVIPYWCSTKILHFMENSDSNSFYLFII